MQLKLALALFLLLPVLADDPPKAEDPVARLNRENEQLRRYIADMKVWQDKNANALLAAYNSCIGKPPQLPEQK